MEFKEKLVKLTIILSVVSLLSLTMLVGCDSDNADTVTPMSAIGVLDTAFDSDGIVTSHGAAGGDEDDSGNAVAIDGSGRIVVVGYSHNGTNKDLTLWRYNSDGSLDTTFDGDGIVIHDNAAGGSGNDVGKSVAIDGSGRIVVTGYSNNGADDDLALWRFNSDGSLDTTFDIDGIVIHDNAAGGSGGDFGEDVVIDGSGRIVVAGMSLSGTNYDLALWRFASDGSLDTTFDGDGVATHNSAAGGNDYDTGRAVVIDGSNRIVVAGYSLNGTNFDTALWRYESDGSLDTTFDVDGIVIHDNAAGGSGGDYGQDVVIDGSGQIVVAGSSDNGTDDDLALWQHNEDGSLDSGFDSDGIVIHGNAAGGSDGDESNAVVIDGSGRIVVTGESWNGTDTDMVLWRFE